MLSSLRYIIALLSQFFLLFVKVLENKEYIDKRLISNKYVPIRKIWFFFKLFIYVYEKEVIYENTHTILRWWAQKHMQNKE